MMKPIPAKETFVKAKPPKTIQKAPAKARAIANALTRGQRMAKFIEKYIIVPEGALVGKPMVLLPEQHDFIRRVYDNISPSGGLITRRAVLSIARKNGKALALNTPIPTPSGWTTMGELEEGDMVLGANGQPVEVSFKSEVHVGNRCFKLRFDDGTSIVADADHQWVIRPGGNRAKWRTVNTLELAQQVKAAAVAIPLLSPLELPEVALDIPPYTLGFWLGDGNSKGAGLTIGDQDFDYVINRVEKEIGFTVKKESAYRKGDSRCVTIGLSDGVRDRTDKTKLTPRLRALNLLHNKHIPQQYLRASAAQRWALLQGLMDSDGSCDIGNGNPRCCFSNTNYTLIRHVFELAKSLGLKASINESWKKSASATKEMRLYFGVSFNAYSDQKVFGLQRKQSRLLPRPIRLTRSTFSYVSEIREVASVPTQCIQVDAPDSLYLAGPGFTVTHNTGLISALLGGHIIGPESRRNSNIYSAARSRDQAGIVFKYLSKSLRMHPDLENLVQITDSGKRIVGLRNNSEYKALSAEASTAHGLSPALTIHDELGQVVGPNDGLYDALETAGGAQEEPLSLIISTQAANDADLLSTIIDDMVKYPKPENVIALYAATREDDIYDPKVWQRVNFALGIFRSEKEFLEAAERAKRMPSFETTFRNLYLNMRVALQQLFVSPSVWKENGDSIDEDLFTSGEPVHLAMDLSARVDLTAVVGAVVHPDTGRVHVKPWVYTPADGVMERVMRDKAPYQQWIEEGYMYATTGRIIDYEQVAGHMMGETADMNIASISFDRWRIDLMKKACKDVGWGQVSQEEFPWLEVGQGFKDMSPRLETFESVLLNRNMNHGLHPLLVLGAGNAIAVRDPAGNRKLDKSKASARIDPLVAAVMAVHAAISPHEGESLEITEDDFLI